MKPSIWTGMYVEKPLPESFDILHGCGWRCFEVSFEHMVGIEKAADPARLVGEAVERIAVLGLDVPQAHALLQADVAHPDPARRREDIRRLAAHLDIAARLGVGLVVVHPGGSLLGDAGLADKLLPWNREAFRRLGDRAGELGLRICLENMSWPPTVSADDMLGLLSHMDHLALGLTLDTSHANMRGLDLPALVRDIAPHLLATHISDNDGSGDQHRTPGNGNIDWPALVAALRAVGYSGTFNLEIGGERHPLPGLRLLKARQALETTEWLLHTDN